MAFESESDNETPEFIIPELPLGTIMVLLSSFAAFTLFALKRQIIRK